LTYGSILMVLIFILVWYALNWTPWGRHVYATGDDPDAAELSGIRTSRVLMSVYMVAGIICAFAAWILIGRIGAISPQAGFTANLDSITAVVIGGTSLFGGRGSIFGTLIGALIVGIFRNGLALADNRDLLKNQGKIKRVKKTIPHNQSECSDCKQEYQGWGGNGLAMKKTMNAVTDGIMFIRKMPNSPACLIGDLFVVSHFFGFFINAGHGEAPEKGPDICPGQLGKAVKLN